MSAFSLKMDIAENRFFNGETSPLFSRQQAQQARRFHQKIAGYQPTPLVALNELSALFGVQKSSLKMNPGALASTPSKCSAALMLSPGCCVKNII
jgi:hypothetical protein